jgi:hypothetical protein
LLHAACNALRHPRSSAHLILNHRIQVRARQLGTALVQRIVGACL